jgi:F0F1-type ATP synthase assembly protein I
MMEKSGATPTAGVSGGSVKPKRNGVILIVAALDMSWRLAIVVLVPIIGGYELDKHLGSTPALTIIGFILAMIGLFLVLKRSVALADEKHKARTKQ